jgi:hypothetical protein
MVSPKRDKSRSGDILTNPKNLEFRETALKWDVNLSNEFQWFIQRDAI